MTDTIKDKILKLLALAESSNPHEAQLASRQAERLMIKWGIEEAELQGRSGTTEDIIEKRRDYHGSLSESRVELGSRVMYALGNLRPLGSKYKNTQTLYVIGHKSDVERFEMLMNSLEVQVHRAEQDWWVPFRDGQGAHLTGWHQYKARRQFYSSFATEVARRLTAMRAEQVQPGTSTELVLVSRAEKVNGWVDERYKLKKTNGFDTGFNYSAHSAGTSAGRSASLGEKGIGGLKGQLA